jgi:raffinose/stachyose/melibiose transport system substrate-binding protein
MKKKVIAAVMAAVMTAGCLAGCGGSGKSDNDAADTTDKEGTADKETEASDDSSKGSGDDIVITLSSRYSNDNPDENYFRQKVEEFNEMDNGITVEMDNISTEADYLDKLRTSFANGDTPNVFQEYGGSRCLDYLEADALVDLKPYLDENSSEWYNSFYESMWGQCIYEGYDGIYAVPFKSYIVALFYNKDLFEQAGLQAPVTIDEMMDACAKFKEMGILPFQAGEKDNYRFGHFNNNLIIKTLGVDAVDKLASRELTYDSDEMKGTYQVMADMVENEYFGENILDTDATTETEAFKAGNVAMKWDGAWVVPNDLYGTDFYDKVGVVPFPYGDESCKNYAQGGASDMFFISKLNKSDEEIAASVEFLQYITSPEYYQGLDEVAQTVVPVKFEKSANSPENPLLDEVIAIQSELTDVRTDVQNYDSESHMLDTVRSALQGLAMGDTADQCAKNIMDRIAEYSGE